MRWASLPLGLLLSCAPAPPAPRWISLAHGHRSAAVETLRHGTGRADVVWDDELGGVWIETDLPDEAWVPAPVAGVFRARRPALLDLGRRLRLTVDGHDLVQLTIQDAGFEPGEFVCSESEIVARLAPDDTPHGTRFGAFLDLGELSPNGRWRLPAGHQVGDGIGLWPGIEETVVTDVPPASRLRLDAVARSLVREAERESARITVRLDGEELGSFAVRVDGPEVGIRHELDLPPEGRRGATLSFRIEDGEVYGVLFVPTIGPAVIGRRGERPWEEARARRPDLVLFVADTFRADGLALHGGPPDLCPNLNALADESVSFLGARATSTWTLPSHASFFTGLQPPQHTAVGRQLALPDELTTVAEHLRRNGYRTAAVTDAGFVSRAFGLDQGFELFSESDDPSLRRTLDESLELLGRDDGRPLFLFVQTYRTHAPYKTGRDEDAEAWHRMMRREGELRAELPPEVPDRELDERLAAEWLELYRRGVHALDQSLGPWLAEVEARGVLAEGALVFTSDHGEAFSEHGETLHGGLPWGEVLRVPLLIRSDRLAARRVAAPVSLLSLPRTLADLAGLPAPDSWEGRSLLAEDPASTVLAYSCDEAEESVVLIRDDHKVFAELDPGELADGVYQSAFDLAADPGEQHDLHAQRPRWAAELCEALAERVRSQQEPVVEATSSHLAEEDRARLEALGY